MSNFTILFEDLFYMKLQQDFMLSVTSILNLHKYSHTHFIQTLVKLVSFSVSFQKNIVTNPDYSGITPWIFKTEKWPEILGFAIPTNECNNGASNYSSRGSIGQ